MSEFVAAIGETKYATLQEAVNAAEAKAVIVMIADSKENVTVPEDKEIVLDLNGFTLSGGAESEEEHAGKAAIYNNGIITIKDTSEAGTGKIMKEDVDTHPSYYVLNNQNVMTIESGYIYNDSGHVDPDVTGGASLICNADEDGKDPGYAKLYIKGGVMEQNNFIAIKNGGFGYVEMTGGKVISAAESAVQNWAEFHGKGGEVDGVIWAMAYDPAGESKTYLSDNIVVNGKIWTKKYDPEGEKPASVEINGGTYNLQSTNEGKPGESFEAINGGTIAITDGSFNVDPSEYLAPNAKITRSPDGKFITAAKGFSIALKPKYPTYGAIEKTIFSEDDLVEILVDEKTLRKVPGLLETCYVAIVVEDKFYPVDIDNYEEQFALVKAGEPVTVEEDAAFGIKKLSYFVGNAIGDEPYKVMVNAEYHNGIIYGTCKKVADFKALGIDGIDANGYWMPFYFDLAKAEAEGYSDLKIYGTDKALVEGANYINVTKDTAVIGIQGKLTVNDIVIDVEMVFDDRLQFVDYHTIDIDPRSGVKAHN